MILGIPAVVAFGFVALVIALVAKRDTIARFTLRTAVRCVLAGAAIFTAQLLGAADGWSFRGELADGFVAAAGWWLLMLGAMRLALAIRIAALRRLAMAGVVLASFCVALGVGLQAMTEAAITGNRPPRATSIDATRVVLADWCGGVWLDEDEWNFSVIEHPTNAPLFERLAGFAWKEADRAHGPDHPPTSYALEPAASGANGPDVLVVDFGDGDVERLELE